MRPNLLLAALVCFTVHAAPPPAAQSTAVQPAFDRLTPDALRADVSFLASDELQGRLTPSPGLDLAASFIAARFRQAGLQPPASGTYFQTANFLRITVARDAVRLTLHDASKSLPVPSGRLYVRALDALDLTRAPLLRLPANGTIPNVANSIVIGDEDRWGDETLLAELTARHPRLILLLHNTVTDRGQDEHRPNDPSFLEPADSPHIPVLRLRDSAALRLLRSSRPLALSLHLPESTREPVPLRNVAALLPGSDPALRNQYILLTAHYDHVGATDSAIFHGANDDASGTASVLEIAAALAALPQPPRRSILFITFFGEEQDLLGSSWYASHPLVPLRDTIANLNLEQLGRTDERTGPRLASFALSGPSYSNLPAILADAAAPASVSLWRPPDADDYFNRSDNFSLAQHGVIAHTAAVAFEFPDYHLSSDTADKLDYDNMALVDRALALGLLRLANQPAPPRWSDSPAAGQYREAGR